MSTLVQLYSREDCIQTKTEVENRIRGNLISTKFSGYIRQDRISNKHIRADLGVHITEDWIDVKNSRLK